MALLIPVFPPPIDNATGSDCVWICCEFTISQRYAKCRLACKLVNGFTQDPTKTSSFPLNTSALVTESNVTKWPAIALEEWTMSRGLVPYGIWF